MIRGEIERGVCGGDGKEDGGGWGGVELMYRYSWIRKVGR